MEEEKRELEGHHDAQLLIQPCLVRVDTGRLFLGRDFIRGREL